MCLYKVYLGCVFKGRWGWYRSRIRCRVGSGVQNRIRRAEPDPVVSLVHGMEPHLRLLLVHRRLVCEPNLLEVLARVKVRRGGVPIFGEQLVRGEAPWFLHSSGESETSDAIIRVYTRGSVSANGRRS